MIINAYHLGWLQPFIVWKLENQPNISSTACSKEAPAVQALSPYVLRHAESAPAQLPWDVCWIYWGRLKMSRSMMQQSTTNSTFLCAGELLVAGCVTEGREEL